MVWSRSVSVEFSKSRACKTTKTPKRQANKNAFCLKQNECLCDLKLQAWFKTKTKFWWKTDHSCFLSPLEIPHDMLSKSFYFYNTWKKSKKKKNPICHWQHLVLIFFFSFFFCKRMCLCQHLVLIFILLQNGLLSASHFNLYFDNRMCHCQHLILIFILL